MFHLFRVDACKRLGIAQISQQNCTRSPACFAERCRRSVSASFWFQIRGRRRCVAAMPLRYAKFETKKLALTERLQRFGKQAGERVQFCWGDLRDTEPFATSNPEQVDIAVHAPAITRSMWSGSLAQQVNVAGSEKAVQILRTLSQTFDVSRTSAPCILQDCSPARWRNSLRGTSLRITNENSKWQAEQILLTQYAQLPWQIFRVATIISERRRWCGRPVQRVSQYVEATLLRPASGLPGKPTTPLYLVTGEFVAEAIFSLLDAGTEHSIYHVAHTRRDAISLGDLVELAFDAFRREVGFSKRRVLPPLYTDQDSFERLAESVRGFGAA